MKKVIFFILLLISFCYSQYQVERYSFGRHDTVITCPYSCAYPTIFPPDTQIILLSMFDGFFVLTDTNILCFSTISWRDIGSYTQKDTVLNIPFNFISYINIPVSPALNFLYNDTLLYVIDYYSKFDNIADTLTRSIKKEDTILYKNALLYVKYYREYRGFKDSTDNTTVSTVIYEVSYYKPDPLTNLYAGFSVSFDVDYTINANIKRNISYPNMNITKRNICFDLLGRIQQNRNIRYYLR